MALKFQIVEGELKKKVVDRFVKNVRKKGLATGFLATSHLLPVLCDIGCSELAFDILFSEKCPGWLYQISRGGTTTWERWDSLKEDGTVNEVKMGKENMVSFNHYAFGAVGEFFYQYILGIKPTKPAYEEVQIKPYIDTRFGYAKGSLETEHGNIEVSWKYMDGKVNLSVVIPNINATVILPDGKIHNVGEGMYSFLLTSRILMIM